MEIEKVNNIKVNFVKKETNFVSDFADLTVGIGAIMFYLNNLSNNVDPVSTGIAIGAIAAGILVYSIFNSNLNQFLIENENRYE